MNNIKDLVANFIINTKLKNRPKKKLLFNFAYKEAETFFIILPENEIDFQSFIKELPFFEANNKKFSLLVSDFRINTLSAKYKEKSLGYNMKDLNLLKLPTKQFSKKLSQIKSDIVIDLNKNENLFFSCAANLIESGIKIGFEKNGSDKFYNLQFSKNDQNTELFYKNFLNCLQMF